MKKTIYVDGMTCGHCKMKVEEALNKLGEIKSAEVDLIEGSVDLELESEIEESLLKNSLLDAGYTMKKKD